jgi:hypothetical protein
LTDVTDVTLSKGAVTNAPPPPLLLFYFFLFSLLFPSLQRMSLMSSKITATVRVR